MKKNIQFTIISIILLFLLIDTFSYILLKQINKGKNLFYATHTVTKDQLESFLENQYDPLLGWTIKKSERNNLQARSSRPYPPKKMYLLKAFGDSFVYGSEVTSDGSFCAFIEEKTGEECLNFGIEGSAPDQALLNYERNPYKTEYTLLGIMTHNVGRLVSYYPTFYMMTWMPPKPRFLRQGDTFRLLENPIKTKQDAYKLLDENFIEQLKEYDYWPNYYDNISKRPNKLHWPATYTIIRHSPFFIKKAWIELKSKFSPSYEIEKKRFNYYHLYEPDSEAFAILKYVIDRFIILAKLKGETPIIVVFPDQFSLDLMIKYQRNPYNLLIDYLKIKKYQFLDIGEFFSEEDYGEFFISKNSHYSPNGNARVADAIIDLIKQIED